MGPILKASCVVYTLLEAFVVEVELQPCPSAPAQHRRFIGPDARELGLFNLNNRIFFSHDLLDEYTSAFTSSETPFAAWISTVSRRYAAHGSIKRFVSEQVFRAAWFGYAQLQMLDGDMTCPECGEFPDNTIWDGVTLAFNQKHILSTLQPPTTLSPGDSPVRLSKSIKKQQLIPDSKLRKTIRTIVLSNELPAVCTLGSNTSGQVPKSIDNPKKAAAIAELVQAIPQVSKELATINQAVADLFVENFGLVSLAVGRKPHNTYIRLFTQVSLSFLMCLDGK